MSYDNAILASSVDLPQPFPSGYLEFHLAVFQCVS